MTTATAGETPEPNNRREYFRINDRIGLRVKHLSEGDFLQATNTGISQNERQSLLNAVIVSSESRRAALRGIREESTAIANYLSDLDEKLAILANLMTRDDSQAPQEQTHDVNLSASGLRFYSDEGYPQGARLEMHLHLFPSETCLRLFGTVAWCHKVEKQGLVGQHMAVAVDYSDIPDDDREILFRHINNLQLDCVRRGVRPSTD